MLFILPQFTEFYQIMWKLTVKIYLKIRNGLWNESLPKIAPNLSQFSKDEIQ